MKSKRLKRRLTRKILRAMLREEQITLQNASKKAFRWTKFDTEHYKNGDNSDTQER